MKGRSEKVRILCRRQSAAAPWLGARRVLIAAAAAVFAATTFAQTAQPPVAPEPFSPQPQTGLQHRPAQAASEEAPQPSVALNVPKGTPLALALDREVRVRRVGQLVHARLVEPVYAFDKLEIPAGSQVTGKVTEIGGVSAGERTEAALDANFTPTRPVEIEFDHISLPNGKHVAVETKVTPGSGQLLDFVSAAEDPNAQKSTGTEISKKRRTKPNSVPTTNGTS